MKTWQAWVRYLRLPNVLSVPGDVLVGAALVDALDWSLLPRLFAVCLAYLFGMALNDLVDFGQDRRERPERPLPSGAISRKSARFVCALLALSAFAAHPGEGMILLLFTIVSYTGSKERFPVLGAMQMALCRMLALWIGAGAVLPLPPALTLSLAQWGLFIFLVTRIASFETRPEKRTLLPILIPMLFFFTGSVWVFIAGHPIAVYGPVIPLVILSLLPLNQIRKQDWRIQPRNIGQLLGLLYWMQLCVLLIAGQMLLAFIPLILGETQRRLRRHIPAS